MLFLRESVTHVVLQMGSVQQGWGEVQSELDSAVPRELNAVAPHTHGLCVHGVNQLWTGNTWKQLGLH